MSATDSFYPVKKGNNLMGSGRVNCRGKIIIYGKMKFLIICFPHVQNKLQDHNLRTEIVFESKLEHL